MKPTASAPSLLLCKSLLWARGGVGLRSQGGKDPFPKTGKEGWGRQEVQGDAWSTESTCCSYSTPLQIKLVVAG